MAPVMWEKLVTGLSNASDRSMLTLLSPKSGILPHIRELDIYGTLQGTKTHRLQLLVTALPRNVLRSFSS
jgi:hypothetical protein